jgi:hypothetical protein
LLLLSSNLYDARTLAHPTAKSMPRRVKLLPSRVRANPATVGPGTSPKRPARPSGESFLAHPAHALPAAGGMLALVVVIAILVPAGPSA